MEASMLRGIQSQLPLAQRNDVAKLCMTLLDFRVAKDYSPHQKTVSYLSAPSAHSTSAKAFTLKINEGGRSP
jgi:hypothetical protein